IDRKIVAHLSVGGMSASSKSKRRVWLLMAIPTFVVCWFVPILATPPPPHGEHVSAWTALTGMLRSDFWDRWDCMRFTLFYTALFGAASALVGWAVSRLSRGTSTSQT